MWQLWPLLPAYGRKAAQFVDLLGYFSLQYTQTVDGSSEKVISGSESQRFPYKV